MTDAVEAQHICISELDLQDAVIDKVPINSSDNPICAIVGLENRPTTSRPTEVELEIHNYEPVKIVDNSETKKSEDVQTELIVCGIIESTKKTSESQAFKDPECSLILDTNQGKDPSQEETEMKLNYASLEYKFENDPECRPSSILDTGKGPSREETEMRLSYASLEYKFENAYEITGAWKEFRKKGDIFMKGCKWSPDGTCILTNSDDNLLRIFDLPRELHCQETWEKDRSLPELEPALKVQEGGVIYDYSWYPRMSSWNPLSCCFISTSKDSPVHLWDAFNGELRCTYRAYNSVDEVETAHSLAFSPSGEKLYCGFKNTIRVFNTNVPGRECTTRNLKRQFLTQKQTGIISCISVNPALPNVYAAGSYSRSIGLYSEPHGTLLCLLLGHIGGITHIQFSPDGTKLLSGGRKDSEIICWDIRNPGNVLFTVKREVTTNQRIYFDITSDSQYFVSGNTNGIVSVWDTSQITKTTTIEPILSPCSVIHAHNDCVNGISIHQQYPVLATTSGQRHVTCSGTESDSSTENNFQDTSLKLWWIGNVTSPS